MTSLSTKPYKGTRDFYPEDMRIQKWIFGTMRDVVQRYGYQEYDGPMLESFDLYAAKTGEEIVNQQLYHFEDRGGRKVAIRPEMTPTLARMVAAKFSELPKPVRWFSFPNLWRYERPQRGRLREHWQLNVDVLGGERVLADAEILGLSVDLVRAFGGESKVKIKINHRQLMDFFFREKLGVNSEGALRITKLVDARSKMDPEKYESGLKEVGLTTKQMNQIEDFFKLTFDEVLKHHTCDGSKELEDLFQFLDQSGHLKYIEFDPSVLRGLDYYTGTVFEMYDISPENNRAMFGGGRYDNLLGLFGKNQLSGVGFGWGDVTMRNFLETHGLLPEFGPSIDVLVTLPQMEVRQTAEKIAESLRRVGLKVITPLSEGKFAAQLKFADRLKTRYAVILGESELEKNHVILKDLTTGRQDEVAIQNLAETIQNQKK